MGVLVVIVNYTVITTFNDSIDFIRTPDSERRMAAFAMSITRHYLKVICALGFPGNIAAIVTITRIRPVSTGSILVALLAASDSAALLVKLVINQFSLYADQSNAAFCHSLPLTNVCSSFANWVLVLIGCERLVAVVLPMMRHRFLSKRRVYCICVVLLLLIFSIHVPMMAGREPRGRKCVLKEEMVHYDVDVLPWLNTLVYALLPQFLLVVITTALFFSLRQAGLRRRVLMGSAASSGLANVTREIRRSERAITSMTITAALLFVLMILPQCLYFILFVHTDLFMSIRQTPKELLIRQIAFVLADSTHALNFYLYFLSVRRFRMYFWKTLRCWRPSCGPVVQSSFSRSSKKDGVLEGTQVHELNGAGTRAGSEDKSPGSEDKSPGSEDKSPGAEDKSPGNSCSTMK